MAHGRRIGRVKFIIPSEETADKYLSIWKPKELHFHPEKFKNITGHNFFETDQPINLEIGCGTGEFLIDMAKKNPEQFFIGIDSSNRSVFYAVDLAQKAKLDNIHFIFGNFNRLYPYLAPNSLRVVYFHFPDPNYGSKNEKKKVFTEKFLEALHPVFTSEGYLSVVTDQDELVEEFSHIINLDKNYERLHEEEYLTSFDTEEKSRFHKAWERVDRPIYQIKIKPVRS
jgi:tRNA (guanine-N7-)-methyltransferase